MKKFLLSLVAVAASLTAYSTELPMGEQFTLNRGDVYSFTPTSDGVLTIEFTGNFPDLGLLYSNLYTTNFNPDMEMMMHSSENANPAMGQKSPVIYNIKVLQPLPGSTDRVIYEVRGPQEFASMSIKATFEAAGEGTVLELSEVNPLPGEVFDFNTIGNLNVNFTPVTYGVSCQSVTFDLYSSGTLKKTVNAKDLEINWEFNINTGYYQLSLINLWLYELKGMDIDAFKVTLSGFNYEITGDYVNEQGAVELNYAVDEWFGIIRVQDEGTWPSCITPEGTDPATVTVTFAAPLSANQGEVVALGTDLPEIGAEPSAKTNVYSVNFSVEGNAVTINFDKFTQMGPVNDTGQVVMTNGYASSASVITVIMRNFMGTDGSQAQPLMVKLPFSTSGVAALPTVEPASAVYNLQGIRVLREASDEALKSLPSGLYIIGGRKVMM